jgi:hypothetical protein
LAALFPDLTPLDFFLSDYIKDTAYVPPLATSLLELTTRKKDEVASYTILNALWTTSLLKISKLLDTTFDKSTQLHLVSLSCLLAEEQRFPKIIHISCINLYMTNV